VSRTTVVLGHTFMTNTSNSPDLTAMAHVAEMEIMVAESFEEVATNDEVAVALSAAEFGYYEAELRSLRDAAITLDEAEHPTG
jgi:hypothetical protein